jgi:hypothetical protein
MAIDWSMAVQPNVLAMALNGYEQGRQLRREEKSRNALAGLLGGMQAPNGTPGIGDGIPGNRPMSGGQTAPMGGMIDPTLSPGGGIGGGQGVNYGDFTPEDLRTAMPIIEKQREAAKEQQAAQIRMRAAQGDPDALQQLVGIDFNSYRALGEEQRRMLKEQNDYVGQAALRISQLPPQQQAMAWDQAIAQGVQRGFSGLADKQGQFSPQALNSAIDSAGLVDKFFQLAEPRYTAIPAGGRLVNTRDPAAVNSVAGGMAPPVAAPSANPGDILRNAASAGTITPEEAATVQQSLGNNPQGVQKFQAWMQQNGIAIAKTINGQTFYQVNGQWFDNPEGR